MFGCDGCRVADGVLCRSKQGLAGEDINGCGLSLGTFDLSDKGVSSVEKIIIILW